VKDLKKFILSFYERKGTLILFSSIFAKLSSFLISFMVIRMVDQDEYGFIVYASTIISFLIPFMGMGAFQSLLRFGASANSFLAKKQIFNYSFSRGGLLSISLMLLVLLFSPLISTSLPNSSIYLSILCFQIISLFILESVKNYIRLLHMNHLYAYIEIINSIVLLISTLGLCYLYGGVGYVIGLVISPVIVGVTVIIRFKLIDVSILNLPREYRLSQFWRYGLFVSFGAVASQLLYSIDIISIGHLIERSEKEIAIYKAASLIPFSLMFIPQAFVTTDFVKISERATEKKFLSDYLKNYQYLFIILSLVMLSVFIPCANYIIKIFGNNYSEAGYLFKIFSIGLAGGFIFRIPCGNLLAAVGKANWNAIVSAVILVLNIGLNYLFVKRYGIQGAAYVTTILIWVSGITTYLLFSIYVKKLDE